MARDGGSKRAQLKHVHLQGKVFQKEGPRFPSVTERDQEFVDGIAEFHTEWMTPRQMTEGVPLGDSSVEKRALQTRGLVGSSSHAVHTQTWGKRFEKSVMTIEIYTQEEFRCSL